MWEGLKIGGFQFDDSMEYALAKKESDIIGYITERMNINDPQVALLVYYKLLERQDMKTVVGLSFLKQLRDYCVESGVVEDSQIKMIPIRVENGAKGKLSSFGPEKRHWIADLKSLTTRYRKSSQRKKSSSSVIYRITWTVRKS